MKPPRLMIAGVTRRNRHETIAALGQMVTASGGWIVDHALFSNVAATIRAEIPRPGLGLVGEKLQGLEVALDAESLRALAGAAALEGEEDIILSLNITFLHDEPDLKHTIPAVPG